MLSLSKHVVFLRDEASIPPRQSDEAAERQGKKYTDEDDTRRYSPAAQIRIIEYRPACQNPRGIERGGTEDDQNAAGDLTKPVSVLVPNHSPNTGDGLSNMCWWLKGGP